MIHHSKHSVTPTELSRRRFLRGVGAAFAVPAFASLLSDRAIAGAASTVAGAGASAAGQLGVTATGAPLRTAFIYFPNGAIQDPWWPTGGGKDFTLSPTLKSLENVKDQIQILGGLDQVNATAGQDGGGDHARAGGTFLTGVRVKKTAGVRRCDRVGESSLEGGDSVQLPVSQSNIDHLRRAAEEALAAAERQIVYKTGNHAMVDVEVRQAAIESCIVIVDCSLVATARVSNAGGGRFLVDCLRPGIHTSQGQ